MKKTFIREVPKARLTQTEIDRLQALGFVCEDKGESVEVWAEEAVS